MADDATVKARLQRSGMGVLAPSIGLQALAAALAVVTPAPAVVSAALVLWDVLLQSKIAPPFFADFCPDKACSDGCNSFQGQFSLQQPPFGMNPEALPHCSQTFTASLGAADRSWSGVLQVAADQSYFHEAAGT